MSLIYTARTVATGLFIKGDLIKFKVTALLTALLFTSTAMASYVQTPYPIVKGGTGSAAQTASRAVTTDGSGNIISTSATTAAEIGFINGLTSAVQTQLNAKASTALSNLASVAINTALLPGGSGTIDLGSTTLLFRDVFITSIKDASNVISVDPINRLLVASSGSTALDYSTTAVAVLQLKLNGSTSGSINLAAGATPTVHTVTLPATVCASGQVWSDNGAGVMSCTSVDSANVTVVNGGDAAFAILAAHRHVRTSTTLTAGRAYTLPLCAAGNIGERHVVKNTPVQTFNITLTAAGSDDIDGAATYVLAPGDAANVVCGVFGANGSWDIY